MGRNELFLQKARENLPRLILAPREPLAFDHSPMTTGDKCLLDFGNHYVGYLKLKLGHTGSHPDAPVWLRIRFAERLQEFSEDVKAYHGWISKGWIQSEELHIDVLPAELRLPRRYAFRYVQVEILDISSKFRMTVENAVCTAVSSANDDNLLPFTGTAEDAQLDKIACRTLHECMQTVFEDGPKRDRRLWIGDLRLQALANYETYRQNDMVKSCLYLFAGDTAENGQVSACMFLEPEIEADDTYMFDYSLFFIATLRDYLQATGDTETAQELYSTALRQWEIAQESFDGDLIRDSDKLGWCFGDWNLKLNKQATAQGVYLYCTKALMELAEVLGKDTDAFCRDYENKKAAAKANLYDGEKNLFVSGADCQISYASQVWMVLGGAADGSVLDAVSKEADAVGMVTPYMYHHYVEALICANRKEQALDALRAYWGGMVKEGADTFWELYNPLNPNESPYGGSIVNSFCHAWSCAPAYFLRKYQ